MDTTEETSTSQFMLREIARVWAFGKSLPWAELLIGILVFVALSSALFCILKDPCSASASETRLSYGADAICSSSASPGSAGTDRTDRKAKSLDSTDGESAQLGSPPDPSDIKPTL